MKILIFFHLLLLNLAISIDPANSNESGMEIIATVPIPIPIGLKKATERNIELSVPRYIGGQEVYEGNLSPKDIIEFYKVNMPTHGWNPYASLVNEGGLLVYIKPQQTVVIMVGLNDDKTTLAIMVGTRRTREKEKK